MWCLEWRPTYNGQGIPGSAFFQEYTTGKKDKSLKTYDSSAFATEDLEEDEDAFWTNSEEQWDEDSLEQWASEDPDAALILQFESAVNETIQDDAELSAYYSSYQEARKRLQEKVKNRGFWGSKNSGPKGFGKKGLKGKFNKGKGFKTLQQRIADSYCRLCNQKGHWKAECPQRRAQTDEKPPQIPTSVATVIDLDDLPFVANDLLEKDPVSLCFGIVDMRVQQFGERAKTKLTKGIVERLRRTLHRPDPTPEQPVRKACKSPDMPGPNIEDQVCFAPSGTSGVVDLGASQTVIGREQLKELLSQLPEDVRKQTVRTACNLVFRFGNHQTLESRTAVLIPLHDLKFRIAVVEGNTPFLISSTLLQQPGAVIDASQGTVWSKKLKRFLKMHKTPKKLFLLDINQLREDPDELSFVQMQEPCLSKGAQQVQRPKQVDPISMQSGVKTADRLPRCTAARHHSIRPTVLREVQSHPNRRRCRSKGLPRLRQDHIRTAASNSQARIKLFAPTSVIMPSDLSGQLSRIQQAMEKKETNNDLQEFFEMEVSEMAKLKTQFGKAKLGLTFEKAFTDLSWTKFVTSKYGESDKKEHRMFVHYAKIRTEQEIQALDLEQWKPNAWNLLCR